jgi:hypothetical protein
MTAGRVSTTNGGSSPAKKRANEANEAKPEEALHQADPDKAQAAAGHHRWTWSFC